MKIVLTINLFLCCRAKFSHKGMDPFGNKSFNHSAHLLFRNVDHPTAYGLAWGAAVATY